MRAEFFKKIILLLILALLPSMSLAFSETGGDGQMVVNISPPNPSSFSQISISVNSFEIDLDRSEILWSLDGQLVKSGIGLKNFSFSTGPVGKKMIVDVSATSQDGQVVNKQIVINPADVDIVWSADSSVPNFYPGKALPGAGSQITLYAIPNFINDQGNKIDASNLVYRWRTDFKDTDNGYGKNASYFVMPNEDVATVSVLVSNLDGTLSAEKILKINAETPKLIFYQVSSLVGILYNSAISGNFNMVDKELTVKSQPYFFPKNSKLQYTFTVDDVPFSSDTTATGMIILRQGKDNGTSVINSTITNVTPPAQASDSFKIIYESNPFKF